MSSIAKLLLTAGAAGAAAFVAKRGEISEGVYQDGKIDLRRLTSNIEKAGASLDETATRFLNDTIGHVDRFFRGDETDRTKDSGAGDTTAKSTETSTISTETTAGAAKDTTVRETRATPAARTAPKASGGGKGGRGTSTKAAGTKGSSTGTKASGGTKGSSAKGANGASPADTKARRSGKETGAAAQS